MQIPDTIPYPFIVISKVSITGNEKTKADVIIRELDFKIGDTLSVFEEKFNKDYNYKRVSREDSSELVLRLDYSRENIINTELFLTVNLMIQPLSEETYELLIDVTERHYWWLFPVVKLNAPNFNEWIRDPSMEDISMGLFFSQNNLWGKGHQTSVAGYIGKSTALAFGYKIPWFGNSAKKTSLTVAAGYSNLYTVEYNSVENKRQMIYEQNSLKSAKVGAVIKNRMTLYSYLTLKLNWEMVKMSDSLFTLNPNFLAKNKQTNSYVSLYADYAYDTRNSKSFPLKGTYMNVYANKLGMGILTRDVDYFYYGIDFHFYQTLTKKWYVAEMFKLQNSAGENHPYYYQANMTFKKDQIRGYDLFTIKGDQMYYFRSNIKYELVAPNIKKSKKPGDEDNKFKNLQYAFYLNAFGDAGYVTNKFTENNPLNNKMLFSWGLGLDFVTYYDLVLRFEYALTSNKTHGFFIGFGMPI